jgi:hypothetical protein
MKKPVVGLLVVAFAAVCLVLLYFYFTAPQGGFR